MSVETVDNAIDVMKPNETVFSDLIGVGYPASTQVRKFFPTQSSFSPSNNICRIYLNSPGFINLSDGVLSFRVKATPSTAVTSYIDGSAHSFIDRLTVYGPDNTILEQILDYGILANAVSDIQLSKDWKSSIGNALCGYTMDPLSLLKPFRVTPLPVPVEKKFKFNNTTIDLSGAAVSDAGDGFVFTCTAAAKFTMVSSVTGAAVAIDCATPADGSVIVNGVLFESRAGAGNANKLFINGLQYLLTVASVDTVQGNYIVGYTEYPILNQGRSFTPNHQSETIAQNTFRTFHLPLVSGVLQCNKYFPSQFCSGQGIYIELQWAAASSALYIPGSTTAPDYTIDTVYYQAPVVNFAGNFYSEFKQVLDAGGVKWHVTNYQSNKRDYVGNTGVKTLTIGSKHRSLKSLVCCLQDGTRSINTRLPKTSYRDFPTKGNFQARIGTVLYPPQPVEFDADNVSELYAELQKAFATLGNIRSNSMIDRYNLFGGCGVIGLDFENYPQTSSTKLAESGLNTISNNQQFDLLINVSSGLANNGNANIYLLHDIILMMTPDGRIIKSN